MKNWAARGISFTLELIGIVVILLMAAAFVLMLRLQQGPLQLDLLTERVEQAFARHQNGFVFDIDETQLTWGNPSDPFMIEMNGLRITRSDTTPIAVVDKARVVLSKRALLLGHIVPREFYMYRPVLRVVRHLDKSVSLNVGAGDLPTDAAVEKAWEDASEPRAEQARAARQQFMDDLVRQIEGPQREGFLGGLRRIVIEDAAIAYEDRAFGLFMRAEHAKIVVARARAGLVADSVFRADFANRPADAPQPIVRLRLSHARGADQTGVTAYFANVVPAHIAGDNAHLAAIKDVNLPFKGQVNVVFDRAMHPSEMAFAVAGGAGSLNAKALYPQPVSIASLVARGRYDLKAGTGDLTEARIDLGVAQAEISADITAADEARRIDVKGVLTGMPLDSLRLYWPEKLATDAQKWVTTNLSKGIADRATIDMALRVDADGAASLESLGGQIDFHDITVDYFPPLQKVTAVTGTATYDADNFNLDIKSGQLRDMQVTAAKIDITNLTHAKADASHAEIDIAVSLSGPLKTALDVIDSEPLRYPSKLGLNPGDVSGAADVDVTFAFPLHKGLQISEVAVTANAVISDARLPKVALGQDLTGGPYNLTLQNGQLRVKGEGRLGDSGVKLDWNRNFTDTQKPAMELQAQLTAPATALKVFGLPESIETTGFLPANVTMTERQNGTATLMLQGDLSPLGLRVADYALIKPEGEAGTLTLELDMKNQRPVALRRVDVTTAALTAQGRVDFSQTGDTRATGAELTGLKFGATDLDYISVNLPQTAGGGYKVVMRGRQLDASPLFAENETLNTDAAAAVRSEPVNLSLTVNRLLTGENRGLDNVVLKLNRSDYRRIEELHLDAQAGGQPLSVRYVPVLPVGKSLRVTAGHAGAALNALGITSAVQGGQLRVDAQPRVTADNPAVTARDMAGTIVISNFETRNTPLLAKLLNALSLSGLRDLLNNKGLSFKKARAQFVLTDRGQPASGQNQRMIRISDGQTSGTSLGLTFEGGIDLWRQVYDINGTIVPVSDLNTLLEKIPLLGDVLTAGGEGVFAATYKITGPQKDPEVSVNPLSVLAPGVLRKIFFED